MANILREIFYSLTDLVGTKKALDEFTELYKLI